MLGRTIFTAMAGAALCASASLAQPAPAKRPPVPASKLFPYLDRYWKLPAAERTLFAPAYLLKRDGAPARDLRIWLIDGAAREPIPVAADGRLERLPTLAQLERGKLEVDAPVGAKLSLSLSFALTLRPASEMNAAELARGIRQADAGAHKAAGMMAVMVPKLNRVVFHGATGGQAVAAAGGASDLPSEAGSSYADVALLARSATIRFSRPPASLEVDEPPKK